jgi:hypothetical protein
LLEQERIQRDANFIQLQWSSQLIGSRTNAVELINGPQRQSLIEPFLMETTDVEPKMEI